MTIEEQLDLWVQGKPTHNPDRDECCPDFSCCQPNLLWPQAKRERFKNASNDERMKMLGGALKGLLQSQGHSVETSADLDDYNPHWPFK